MGWRVKFSTKFARDRLSRDLSIGKNPYMTTFVTTTILTDEELEDLKSDAELYASVRPGQLHDGCADIVEAAKRTLKAIEKAVRV